MQVGLIYSVKQQEGETNKPKNSLKHIPNFQEERLKPEKESEDR